LCFSSCLRELEICWLPASPESQRFCFAEAVNHNILITSPFPITNNVHPNLANFFCILIGGMSGMDVVCQRSNTKIEKEEGKKAHPYTYFCNLWGRQAERKGGFTFPCLISFFLLHSFNYSFSGPFKIVVWKEGVPILSRSDHEFSAGIDSIWCYRAFSTSLCLSRNLSTCKTTRIKA